MKKGHLVALFLAGLVPSIVGAGALPLLPIYAAELGAPPIIAGYYLAFAYLAVTAGTLVSGWLSDRFGRRRVLLIIIGVLGIPATWAMGRVASVWTLTLATATVWFLGGAGMALNSILVGVFAAADERGKAYGFLSLTGGLGGLAGGLLTGPLADRWGYPTMFALLSFFFALWPLAALVLRDKRADQVIAGQRSIADQPSVADKPAAERGPRFGKGFGMLFASSLVAGVASFVGIFGRSLSMRAQGFSAAAVSSTIAVSSAFTLPLPLLIGWLSDRLGRKWFLLLSYLISAVGLVFLSLSSALWHFWGAVALIGLSFSIGSAVGQALANDLIPRESLGRGLGLFSATSWMGAVVGFAGTGQAVQHLGLTPTLLAGAVLPLVSILLLAPVRPARDGPSD